MNQSQLEEKQMPMVSSTSANGDDVHLHASIVRLLCALTGSTPFKMGVSLPAGQRIRSALGGKPKNRACKAYGRAPGLKGALAAQLELPSDPTDRGSVQ
jgi:hypothetical protein